MKPISLLVLMTILVAGCASVPRTDVQRAYAKYALVNASMNRSQAIAIVGQPQTVDENGISRWKTVASDGGMAAELAIRFDGNGRITRLSRSESPVATSHAATWIEPAPEGSVSLPRRDHQGHSGDPLADGDIPPLH